MATYLFESRAEAIQAIERWTSSGEWVVEGRRYWGDFGGQIAMAWMIQTGRRWEVTFLPESRRPPRLDCPLWLLDSVPLEASETEAMRWRQEVRRRWRKLDLYAAETASRSLRRS